MLVTEPCTMCKHTALADLTELSCLWTEQTMVSQAVQYKSLVREKGLESDKARTKCLFHPSLACYNRHSGLSLLMYCYSFVVVSLIAFYILIIVLPSPSSITVQNHVLSLKKEPHKKNKNQNKRQQEKKCQNETKSPLIHTQTNIGFTFWWPNTPGHETCPEVYLTYPVTLPFPFQGLSTAKSSLVRNGTKWTPCALNPLGAGTLSGLKLCTSSVCCQVSCEFTCTSVL